ncbi:FdtA/QdtA family cupin domain-containing protein [Romboutsia timonensis]|uniref:sugar 3,4-ketoisomerase n=1 Tax=Romboutsia timonensis TaxID=1776391 RepID=UPI002A7F0EC8|nr:FdtA/QdtA family cupin domain-containing protein [Romboutsia timonensis]MDY3959073.1 FdtA/QdtA family cupin domain-containing protein [Romboutsia timonensis]
MYNKIYKFNLNIKGTKDTGFLVPLELGENISFEIKRIFYTYGVPFESNRGAHAYHNTEQILICVSGSLKIKCFDGNKEIVYELNSPNEALYISPKVWRTTFEHSPDAVLVVLSSLEYDENDYIRDYDEFEQRMYPKC